MSEKWRNEIVTKGAAADAAKDAYKRIPTTAIRAMMAIKELPAAQPMRKKGRWIIEKDTTGATYGRCSVCGIKQYGGHMNFCYECGADMRGEDER